MDIFSLIEFEDPNKSNSVIKASIHKTGKLGFSSGAQEFLNLKETSSFKVGFNPNDEGMIYLVPTTDENQAFKVSKAGDYYYINLKHVFDKKGIEYQSKSVIYDIKKEITNEVTYYILTKRNK